MNKLQKIIKWLNKIPSNLWGMEEYQEIREKDVTTIEKKLFYVLPKDFKFFLLNYNWIIIPWDYIYCIKIRDGEFIFDLYKNSIDEYNSLNPMPKYLVPFSPNGRGDHYCFNKKDDKIYFWQHDAPECDWNPDYECDTFTEWLETSIKEALEVLLD